MAIQISSYKAAVERIADHLLLNCHKDTAGIFWRTKTITFDQKEATSIVNNSLYNGNAGIALFFLELYQVTGEKKYKEVFLSSLNWQLNHYNTNAKNENNQAFLTGNMSTIYLLLRAFETLQITNYLHMAEEIARSAIRFLSFRITDFINGISGTLWILIKLHSHIKEEWLVKDIERFTWELINRLYVGEEGIYWDRSHRQIHGLCGFSHGASGVGFVLMEAGRVFNIDALIDLGMESFRYENRYFDEARFSWFDFRKGIDVKQDEEAFREAFLSNDMAFFEHGSHMNMWCHGGAGIGLSRMYALYMLGRSEFAGDIEVALASVRYMLNKKGTSYSHCICHGIMGNLEIFLLFQQWSGTEDYLPLIQEHIERVEQERQALGFYSSGVRNTDQDIGLFLGDAGIGYQLLRFLYPQQVPSILLPHIREAQEKTPVMSFHIDRSMLIEILIKKTYPRTISLVKVIDNSRLQDFLFDQKTLNINQLYKKWKAFITSSSGLLPAAEAANLTEVHILESRRYALDINIRSNAYLSYQADYYYAERSKYENEQGALSDQFFEEHCLLLDRSIEMMQCRHSYQNGIDLITGTTDELHIVLLQPRHWGVKEYWFEGPLIHLITNVFREASVFREGIGKIMAQIEFEGQEPTIIQDTKSHIEQLVIDLLKAGVLQFVKRWQ